MSDLAYAPHFGVYHLTLVDAGELIAKCLWFRGEIKVSVPDKECYALHDPDLTKAIAKHAAKFTTKLQAAVQAGDLFVVVDARDIDGQVQPDVTYVDALALAEWLEQRGIVLGAAFHDEYLAEEEALALQVANTVAAQRLVNRKSQELSKAELAEDAEKVFLQHRVLVLEEELAALKRVPETATPIGERQRTSYLKTIGALLGLLLGHSPSGQPYSKFDSQQAVIDGIHANFGEQPGLSTRNLQDKFAGGKRHLNEA